MKILLYKLTGGIKLSDRIVYLGDFKNIKKQDLFDKALKELKDNKGDKFYYMLPNGSLLKDYRQRFVREVKSSFDINLFTFDDIVNSTLENSKYLAIDNIWKSFIISQVLEKLVTEGKIIYYKNISSKTGFIESLNFIIGEIKRSLVSPEEYLKRCPDTPEYIEIGIIYSAYENYIEERDLIDREGSYTKALEVLNENDKSEENFNDIKFIIIDEFYDFRPIEIEILKMMKKSDMDIYINIPFNMEYKSSILENTMCILKDLGFDIEIQDEKNDNLFLDIGKNFFNYKAEKLKYTDDILLVESPNSHLEIKKVFSQIKRIHSRGTPFNEIGIVALSDEYREEIIEISKEEELPLSIETQLSLIKVPFIRDLLKSLKDNFEELDKTIEIKDKDSFENYYEIVTQLIEEKEIKSNIRDIYFKIDDFDLYKRDLLAFDKLLEILSDIQKIEIWEECIQFKDYLNLLIEYLNDETIYIKHENTNGIKVMNPVNTRGFEYDKLFVVGMSQNQYPILKANNFFLRDENKDTLKKIGIHYWDYNDRLDNEAIKFANLISMAKEKLYLTYSTGDQGIPSMFLEEILDRFEGEKVDEKIEYVKLELDYIFKNELDQISTSDELINHLLLNLDKEDKFKKYFAFYNELEPHNLSNINQKIIAEYRRSKDEFDEYSGVISDNEIIDDIVEIHKEKIYSSTYLESYSKCPFAFFMKYILHIDEIDIEDEGYNPMDIGSIYHEVLRSYYFKYKDDIELYVRDEDEFDIDNTLDYLNTLVLDEARGMKLDIEKRSSSLVLESIYMYLKDYIKSDINRLKTDSEKSIPLEFEVEFGRSREFLLDTDDRGIKLTGKIDRIDKILDEEKYILIDYKSGSSGIYDIESMREGLSLQLPIYILSQEEKNIVLGMYGEIKNSKFSWKIGVIDQTSIITKKNKGAISTEEKDDLMRITRENIVNIVDGISKADFSVNPKECSSYCIYKDICRYDQLVEVEV